MTTIPKTLHFITSNAHKLAEVRAILEPGLKAQGITLTNQSVELEEIQAASAEEVTRDKCARAAKAINGPVLVEDAALCFDAMGELPGPYIKWFVTQLGPDNLYKMLTGFSDHTATSVCTFGYTAGPGQDVLIFQGRTSGRIVPARGPRDFGWDSAFEYDGRTYAEMPKEEKNKISHRGKALAKLRAWLEGGEVDK